MKVVPLMNYNHMNVHQICQTDFPILKYVHTYILYRTVGIYSESYNFPSPKPVRLGSCCNLIKLLVTSLAVYHYFVVYSHHMHVYVYVH